MLFENEQMYVLSVLLDKIRGLVKGYQRLLFLFDSTSQMCCLRKDNKRPARRD